MVRTAFLILVKIKGFLKEKHIFKIKDWIFLLIDFHYKYCFIYIILAFFFSPPVALQKTHSSPKYLKVLKTNEENFSIACSLLSQILSSSQREGCFMISLWFYGVSPLYNIPSTHSSPLCLPLLLTFPSSCCITKKTPGGSDWKNAEDQKLPQWNESIQIWLKILFSFSKLPCIWKKFKL